MPATSAEYAVREKVDKVRNSRKLRPKKNKKSCDLEFLETKTPKTASTATAYEPPPTPPKRVATCPKTTEQTPKNRPRIIPTPDMGVNLAVSLVNSICGYPEFSKNSRHLAGGGLL